MGESDDFRFSLLALVYCYTWCYLSKPPTHMKNFTLTFHPLLINNKRLLIATSTGGYQLINTWLVWLASWGMRFFPLAVCFLSFLCGSLDNVDGPTVAIARQELWRETASSGSCSDQCGLMVRKRRRLTNGTRGMPIRCLYTNKV